MGRDRSEEGEGLPARSPAERVLRDAHPGPGGRPGPGHGLCPDGRYPGPGVPTAPGSPSGPSPGGEAVYSRLGTIRASTRDDPPAIVALSASLSVSRSGPGLQGGAGRQGRPAPGDLRGLLCRKERRIPPPGLRGSPEIEPPGQAERPALPGEHPGALVQRLRGACAEKRRFF
ncbi:MAG: hypothetical protein MZV70_22170 [Desulfobacterales bacterium]|nr:hypothetical protein [Desulfobacterales bacterium]